MTKQHNDAKIHHWLAGYHPGNIRATVLLPMPRSCYFCKNETLTGVYYEEWDGFDDPHEFCDECAERVVGLADETCDRGSV